MLEVKLLGTGSVMPTRKRFLTSMLVKYNDVTMLVDCGEGTQLALLNAEENVKNLEALYLSNFHRDHISGISGLIELMKSQKKTTPFTIIGPQGVATIVKSVMITPEMLPFKINYIEFESMLDNPNADTRLVYRNNGLNVTAFKLRHTIPSYGYSFEVTKPRKINKEIADELGLDSSSCQAIINGATITFKGKTVNPEVVLEKPEQLAKVVYCMDTEPCETLMDNLDDTTVFIAGCLRFAPKDSDIAIDRKYLGVYDAANLASAQGVKELWMVGTSSDTVESVKNLEYARNYFTDTIIPKDGHTKVFGTEELQAEVANRRTSSGTSFF